MSPDNSESVDRNASSPFNRTVQHDAKRAAILGQAAKLFNTRGARSTTLLDVAQALGLTKTSLYYYVKSKEDLIYQCYRASCDLAIESLQKIDAKPLTGLEKVKESVRRHFLLWNAVRNGERDATAVLLEIASLKDQHREDIEQRYIELFKLRRGFIRKGMEDGSIDSNCEPNAATIAVNGTTEWLFNWLYQTKPDDIEALAESACDLLANGLNNSKTHFSAPPLELIDPTPEAGQGFDREYQNKLKQDAFYRVGTRFFNLRGFNGASLDEIAETLDVTKGAFYYHIKNKEDLLFECYKRSLRISRQIRDQAKHQVDGLHMLDHVCRQSFAFQNSDRGPLIRYNSVTSLPIPRRKEILDETAEASNLLGAFIQQGIEDGSVRPVNVLVAQECISGAVNASMELDKWRSVDDLEATSVDYFRTLIDGLAPRP